MPECVWIETGAGEQLEGIVLERDWFGSPTLVYIQSKGVTLRRDWIGFFQLEATPGRLYPPTA